MTLAEHFIQQGRQQALEDAEKKGLQERYRFATLLLAKGCKLHEVQEVTGLSLETLKEIQHSS